MMERMRGSDMGVVFLVVRLNHYSTLEAVFGEETANHVLTEAREVVAEVCRSSDSVVVNDHDIVVIGRSTKPRHGRLLAERIRSRIEQHVFTVDNGLQQSFTCSLGYAPYPFVPEYPNLLSEDQVLELAIAALGAAERTSRNTWIGYLSTPNSTINPDLIRTSFRHPEGLVRSGLIGIETSLSASS
jgi:GGDEF domain-containing protein